MSDGWMTAAEIAACVGITQGAVLFRARREGRPYRTRPADGIRGPSPRVYEVSALPASIRQKLGASPAERLRAAAPELLKRLEVSTAELEDYRDMMRSSCSDPDGRIADPVDAAEIRSLSLEIGRNREAIDRARGSRRAS